MIGEESANIQAAERESDTKKGFFSLESPSAHAHTHFSIATEKRIDVLEGGTDYY